MDKVNIVPIYSKNVRILSLGLSFIGIFAIVINILLESPFINTGILIWCLTLFLVCVNFSKLGDSEKKDKLSRYISLKATFTYFVGFLLATSFIEIFFNYQLPSVKLFAALSSNIIFIATQYVLYYFILDEQTSLNDESFNTLLKTQKPLILAAFILSLITLLFILFLL